MEIRTLEYFLAVAQEENISRAAEVLHVTQPTLSRQMTQLEEELGVPLFVRGKGKRLSLTDAGVVLQHRAEEVVMLKDKIESEFRSPEEVGGVISIGSGMLSASRVLPAVMDGFRKKYPKVQYKLYTNSAEYIKEQLEQGTLDMGMLLEPIDVTKFDYIRMNEKEKYGLLLRSGHPLAQKEYITKEDLFGEPLITTGRRSIQKELETWLGAPLSELNIFATYNLVANVAILVDCGVASALTLEGSINLFGSDRMVFRPLYPELSLTSVLAWKKFQPNFGAAGRFIEYLKSMQ